MRSLTREWPGESSNTPVYSQPLVSEFWRSQCVPIGSCHHGQQKGAVFETSLKRLLKLSRFTQDVKMQLPRILPQTDCLFTCWVCRPFFCKKTRIIPPFVSSSTVGWLYLYCLGYVHHFGIMVMISRTFNHYDHPTLSTT